jgi:hypothetical protein
MSLLLSKYQRFFLQFQMQFRAARSRGLPLPFQDDLELDVIDALKSAQKAGTANLIVLKSDTVELMKIDVRQSSGVAILLFRRRDPDASSQIFEHQQTKALRSPERKKEEAPAISCHLFVRLKANTDGSHNAILEEIPGLGRSYIEAIIKKALKERAYSFKDSSGDEHETYTVAELAGVMSDTLGSALQESVFAGIELKRPATFTGLDEKDVVARYETLRLQVKTQPDDRVGLVERLRKLATKNNWDELKVHFRMPDDRSRVVTVDRDQAASEVMFIKAHQVDIENEMPLCTEVVNEELTKKAIEFWKS